MPVYNSASAGNIGDIETATAGSIESPSGWQTRATGAIRETANGGEFVLRAWKELGLHIDVITGAEEARLIFEAARRAIDFRGHRPLVVDIGGGSVELVLETGGDAELALWAADRKSDLWRKCFGGPLTIRMVEHGN